MKSLLQVSNNINLEPAWPSHLFLIPFSLFKKYFSDLFTTEGWRKQRKWLNTNVISISKYFVFSVQRAAPRCSLWFKNNFYVLGLSDLFTKRVKRRCAFSYLARNSKLEARRSLPVARRPSLTTSKNDATWSRCYKSAIISTWYLAPKTYRLFQFTALLNQIRWCGHRRVWAGSGLNYRL